MRIIFQRFLLFRMVAIVMVAILASDAWADCDLDYKLAAEAGNGKFREVERLLAEGAHINPRCNNFPPPLFAAIYYGKNDMVEFLVRNGAKVDAYNPKSGAWAIIAAAEYQNFAIVQFLIERGANVDRKDKRSGNTALHWAAKKPDVAIAQDLISAGANVNAKNRDGRTPLDIAHYYGYRDIIDLLESQTSDNLETLENGHSQILENNCSRKDVLRLLDAQFTKEEIKRMCR